MLESLTRQLEAFKLCSAATLLENLNYTVAARIVRDIANRHERGQLPPAVPLETCQKCGALYAGYRECPDCAHRAMKATA